MIVRLLLQHGAFPNVLDTERNTPLHWAAEYDHKDIILLLLENNCEASLHIKPDDRASRAGRERLDVDKDLLPTLQRFDEAESAVIVPRLEPSVESHVSAAKPQLWIKRRLFAIDISTPSPSPRVTIAVPP